MDSTSPVEGERTQGARAEAGTVAARRRALARQLVAVAIAVAAMSAPLSAKRKDDSVVLITGDRLVGEIKELAQGELHFKTGYILNEFHIDWAQVRELQSLDSFRVQLGDGRRLTGTIVRRDNGEFVVTDAAGVQATIPSTEVVGMLPVEASVWAQMTGQINSGYSYTSGDSQSQFSASGSLGYSAERYLLALSGSSNFSRHSNDGGSGSTKRNTAALLNQFPIKRVWFAGALVDLLNSDEQDLHLRTTAGGGIGRWFARRPETLFSGFAGVVYTHEQYQPSTDASEVRENVEGVVTLAFIFHRFKTTDVETKFTVYPSFSTPGRYRLNLGPSLNIEIVRNLYWNFTLYENFDSEPPVDANKNDFGVTNSFGWKF